MLKAFSQASLLLLVTFAGCPSEDEPTPSDPFAAVLRVSADRNLVVAGGELHMQLFNPLSATLTDPTLADDEVAELVRVQAVFAESVPPSDARRTATLVLPADAPPGRHTLTFCAGLCITPDESSEQIAEFDIVVVPAFGANDAGARVAGLAAGDSYSLAIMDNGRIWSWGRNNLGQLGLGDGTPFDVRQPFDRNVPVRGFAVGPGIAAGGSHGHIFDPANSGDFSRFHSFGSNSRHQLGGGTDFANVEFSDITAVRSPDPDGVIVSMAAGRSHTLAIMENGGRRVFAWGSDSDSQTGILGAGPAAVPGTEGASFIAAGASHSLAIVNGELIGWGKNQFAQVGPGSVIINTPQPVHGLDDVFAVAAGDDFTIVLRDDGSVWTFGRNTHGQLGHGTVGNNVSTPTRVPGLADIAGIAAGDEHCLAVTGSGDLYAWGSNAWGQLGQDTLDDCQPTPILVRALANVDLVAAGARHSLARRSDCPHLYAWGDNRFGQLGDGTLDRRETPVQVDGIGEGTNDDERAGCLVELTVIEPQFGAILIENTRTLCEGDGFQATCAEQFLHGAEARLSAVPDAGYELARWVGGSTDTTPTTTVVMDRAKNVSAVFRPAGVPPASFTFAPAPGLVGQAVTFDASGSGSLAERYEWDFGDGSIIDTTEPVIQHTFDSDGSYLVALIVYHSNGGRETTSDTVPVIFQPTQPLTIRVEGAGSATVRIPATGFETTQTVTTALAADTTYVVQFVPDKGTAIVGTTGCTADPLGQCTVTMDGPREITVTLGSKG